jgi:hypothetical protein
LLNREKNRISAFRQQRTKPDFGDRLSAHDPKRNMPDSS